jgi:hypothetical protein
LALAAGVFLMAMAASVRADSDLSALIDKARDNFRPVSAEQLAGDRRALEARMGQLERFVNPSSSNGQRWLKFLKWNALQEQLASPGPPELAVLDATLAQLNRDENGLELARFRAVSDALRQYRDRLAVSQWEDPAAIYAQQLDALSGAVNQFRDEPTARRELDLANTLGVIAAVGQAPELVAAVRREFGQPNAFLEVSADLLRAASEPINRSEPITDYILGTRIRGDASTTGHVAIVPVPSNDSGVLQLTSTGHSVSQNVGYNGPAIIRSTGHTDFTATKQVELTKDYFRSLPAFADARTRTNIHSINKRGGGLGSRIVSNQGWQRARRSIGRADAIASDHAEDRIERQFNREVNQKLSDARKRYDDDYVAPLARRGEVPQHIQFRTTNDALALEVTQAGRGQLGAAAAPPAPPSGRDVTMRLHESAVNNYTALLLGGATASEDKPDQETSFDVRLPEWLKDAWADRQTEPDVGIIPSAEGFKPWSLRFRPGRPISVAFQDDQVKLTLHIARLQSGDSTPFTNWDVWGTFLPEHKDGKVVLRREGDLDAMPTDLQGELGSRRAAQRNNLLKEFNNRSAQGRGFPNKIEFPEFRPEGPLANAGPLQLREILTRDGWLTLVWDRASRPVEKVAFGSNPVPEPELTSDRFSVLRAVRRGRTSSRE